MTRTSLRTRMILVSSTFVTLIWLLAIIVVAFNLKWFLDRVIDIELERDMRLSRHLYEIIRPTATQSMEGLENLYQDVGMITALQGEWGFKVYADDGALIIGSTHVPDFPVPTAEGFADLELDGELWRALSRRIEQDSIWTVLLANKTGANTVILQNLNPTPWMLLLILPLTILAVIYGVHRATRPIVSMERRVRLRSPRSLEPLEDDNLPVEIEPLVSAVNQLLGRVKNLVDHEHRFVANAAHELQTPLAAMKTELQNCLAQAPEPELARTLARLEQRVNRSVHSVKQLLTLARLDPDAPLEKNDAVNLEPLVYDELAALGDDLLALDLQCEVDCAGAILRNCNPELLQVLVRNLVENAIKYAPAGSDIEISAGIEANTLALRVANDCAPMSEDTMQHLRDSFFRVPGNDATGVGLGLAIVDRIIALHDGALDFQYRQGQSGLAVTARFPLQQ